MVKLTLIDKELEFAARYAAPSVTTGRFVACIQDSDEETLREAFTNPGQILVHNVEGLYEDRVYEGFTTVGDIREDEDDLIVIVNKEGT